MNEDDSASNQTQGARSEPALIASALAAAVDRYGPSLFLDHGRLKVLLDQACPDAPREITLLLTALGEDIPQRMLTAHTDDALQSSMPDLVDRLVKNAVFDRKSAVWAVKVWARALALPVTGLDARPAIAIPLPSYAVNFAAVVTPLSVRPVLATPPPAAPSIPDPPPEAPAGPPEVFVEPAVVSSAHSAGETAAAPQVAEPAAPAIEAFEQIVVPSPPTPAAPVPETPAKGAPPDTLPADSPPPLPAWATVPDAQAATPPASIHGTSRRGMPRARRNALAVGGVLVAVAIVALLFRSAGLFSAPASAPPEVLAMAMTTARPDAPVAPVATEAPAAVPEAQVRAPVESPPSVKPPADAAPVPAPQTREPAAVTPPAAPAPLISSVQVPRLVAGKPFVVGVNVSGAPDTIAAIESKVIDNHARTADDAKLTPLADLKRGTDGAWLVPFKAIDAPSRGTLRLALVDAAGQRSPSKTVDLQVTAPSAAAAPLPACTRATCGNVVSVREVQADRNFEVIVRMDDRTIRAVRQPARWPVGARVQQTDGRYVVKGGDPAKKTAPERSATKAPDIFGSIFSKH